MDVVFVNVNSNGTSMLISMSRLVALLPSLCAEEKQWKNKFQKTLFEHFSIFIDAFHKEGGGN